MNREEIQDALTNGKLTVRLDMLYGFTDMLLGKDPCRRDVYVVATYEYNDPPDKNFSKLAAKFRVPDPESETVLAAAVTDSIRRILQAAKNPPEYPSEY